MNRSENVPSYILFIMITAAALLCPHVSAAGEMSGCGKLAAEVEEFYGRGEYSETFRLLKEARTCYLESSGGVENADSARLLNRLGRAAGELGDYGLKREYYERALETLLSVHGTENHPDVAESVYRLGILEFDKGNNSAADGMFGRLEGIAGALGAEAPGVRGYAYSGLCTSAFAAGDFGESLEWARKAVDAHVEAHGETHPVTAEAYRDLATLQYSHADYQGAYSTLIKVRDIYRELYGEGHPLSAAVYEWLGYVFLANSENDNALANFKEALRIRMEKLGPSHPDTLDSVAATGYYYTMTSSYNEAREYYRRALDLALSIYPENHPVVADAYNNLATVLDNLGELDTALEYIRKSVAVQEAIKGGNHPDVALAYSNLSITLKKLGRYEEALDYANRSLEIWLEALGKDHQNLTYAYNSLAMIYQELADYDKAGEYLEEAIRVSLLVNGRDSDSTAVLYNNLGYNDELAGDYGRALENYSAALDIYTRLFGENNIRTATANSNVGSMYARLGRTDKSLEHTMKSVEITKSVYGDRYHRLATFYNNIGMDYMTLGRPEEALEYFTEALGIGIENVGGNHPDIALTYGNIAAAHSDLGHYEKTIEYEQKAVDIYRSFFGESHPEYARALSNISTTYYDVEEYEKAQEMSAKAVKALCGGKEFPEPEDCLIETNVVNALRNNASGYFALNKYQEAVKSYEAAADMLDALRGRVHGEAAKKAHGELHYQMFPEGINAYIGYATREGDSRVMTKALELAERGIGRVFLEMLGRSRAKIDGGLPPAVLEEGERLAAARRAALDAVRAEEMKPRAGQDQSARRDAYRKLQQIESDIETYNSQLLADYPEYAELMNPSSRPLAELEEELLSTGTAILEFYLGKNQSFLIFDSEKIFTIEYLPGADEIEKRVELHRKKITDPSTMLRSAVRSGEKLYDILFGDIDEYLDGVESLLIVPTGRLYFLPFETLVKKEEGEKKFLVEKYRIRYAPSLNVAYMVKQRELKRGAGWSGGSKEWLGFGDPVYSAKDGRSRGLEISEETQTAASAYSRAMSESGDGARAGGAWLRLPGTQIEIESISRLFDDTEADMRLGIEASEKEFKELAPGGSRFLHLATHGSLGEGGAQQPALVMSLVGNSGSGEDGFLTMTDVFNMKIPSELVVLSACKTGQGEMTKGEGVAGMARAFLYAGADSMLVSLWSVADKETKDLMISFYNKMLGGMDRESAIAETKREMIAAGMHPYFWAPFVYIGAE